MCKLVDAHPGTQGVGSTPSPLAVQETEQNNKPQQKPSREAQGASKAPHKASLLLRILSWSPSPLDSKPRGLLTAPVTVPLSQKWLFPSARTLGCVLTCQ